MTVFAHRHALVLRRRTVSSKVTDEEYAAFEALALANNKTVSDWVRDTLLTVVPLARISSGRKAWVTPQVP